MMMLVNASELRTKLDDLCNSLNVRPNVRTWVVSTFYRRLHSEVPAGLVDGASSWLHIHDTFFPRYSNVVTHELYRSLRMAFHYGQQITCVNAEDLSDEQRHQLLLGNLFYIRLDTTSTENYKRFYVTETILHCEKYAPKTGQIKMSTEILWRKYIADETAKRKAAEKRKLMDAIRSLGNGTSMVEEFEDPELFAVVLEDSDALVNEGVYMGSCIGNGNYRSVGDLVVSLRSKASGLPVYTAHFIKPNDWAHEPLMRCILGRFNSVVEGQLTIKLKNQLLSALTRKFVKVPEPVKTKESKTIRCGEITLREIQAYEPNPHFVSPDWVRTTGVEIFAASMLEVQAESRMFRARLPESPIIVGYSAINPYQWQLGTRLEIADEVWQRIS